ncbi:hypothetical protein AB0M20_40405 [Actinoplanes sp. NPDC051633]|uniref:hypothetical protein n=1 Tax=Actinoplanes sp. NPDC051633 TaxID=3155670 RepID=UPI00341C3EB7
MTEAARASSARWPVGPVLSVGDAGPLGTALSEGDGESKGIYPLVNHPGWLVKIYKAPQGEMDTARLNWLIAVPEKASPVDRTAIREHTCWPVARLTDDFGRSIGCVLPAAPAEFRIGHDERYLEVDLLAKPDESIRRRGLPVPSWSDRVAACVGIATIGAVLERNALVYSDWSYSNMFWNPAGRSVYLIDIDGIGFRVKPNMAQPNWDDPLTVGPAPADVYTDRYRIALLVGRCLTGRREHDRMVHGLARISPEFGARTLLLDILLAADRIRRPSVSAMHAALSGLPYLRTPLTCRPMPPMPPDIVRRRPQPAARPGLVVPPPGSAAAAKSGSSAGMVMLGVVVAVVVLIICVAMAGL